MYKPGQTEYPWERQPGEPGMWFNRFDKYYRPLGPDRNLLRAFNFYERMKKGMTEEEYYPDHKRSGYGATWRNRAKEWAWVERAEAWDEHIRQERLKAEERLRVEAREERLRVIADMKEALVESAGRARDKMLSGNDPTFDQLLRWATFVFEQERNELGDVTPQKTQLEFLNSLGVDVDGALDVGPLTSLTIVEHDGDDGDEE